MTNESCEKIELPLISSSMIFFYVKEIIIIIVGFPEAHKRSGNDIFKTFSAILSSH